MPRKPKASFLLPNLLTSGALFCGFYAIIAGMQGDFYAGAVAILSGNAVSMAWTGGLPTDANEQCLWCSIRQPLGYGELWPGPCIAHL